MSFRIAVCDDCEADLEYVSSLLTEWAGKKDVMIQTDTFSSAESFLFHYAEDKGFDLLLLDVEMSAMDGVTMAKKIRQDNEAVQIVFITGYSDYIAEGYEVAALHYLMKPVNKEKLFHVLDRALEKQKQNERYLNLELSGELLRLPFYEIRYLEVRQNYVTVYAKEEYTVKRTLGEFEKELDSRFFRAGRSVILNLKCVQRVTKKEVFLSDGTVLPLPRGVYDSLNRAIIAYT